MDVFLLQVMAALRGMWRRRWIGLAVAWVVAIVGAVVLLRIPDRHEASARVYVDTQTVLRPLLSGLAVQPNVDEQIVMLARTLIARPNIEKIIRSSDLDIGATTQVQKDRLVDSVTQRLKFSGSGRENIYSVSFQDTDPERAKRVVQDLLSLFVESGVGNKRRDAESARKFIDDQIKAYETKLEEAESRVKEFKIRNLGYTGGQGQDYFARMSALSEEVSRLRTDLRVAEQTRDTLKRELSGEDPVLLPEVGMGSGLAQASDLDVRIATLAKALDELLRRYTDEHPDVVATRRLMSQLEQQKKQELDARRKAAAANPSKFSGATNPVFQQLKLSLADAETNVSALRTRLAEAEERLGQLKSTAGRTHQVEAELVQLTRDYEILKKNYDQLVARRESASIAEDVDAGARMAEFRIIEPPRISPKPVFPNRLALVPLLLALALGAGAAVALAVAQVIPTFYDARQVRTATKRAVLGTVSLQPTLPVIRRRRTSNFAFAGGVASLVTVYGSWIVWVMLAARA